MNVNDGSNTTALRRDGPDRDEMPARVTEGWDGIAYARETVDGRETARPRETLDPRAALPDRKTLDAGEPLPGRGTMTDTEEATADLRRQDGGCRGR